jgi:transaldolase
MLVEQDIRVNLTLLLFTTTSSRGLRQRKEPKEPAYVSRFVGRLDDIGQNGMDIVMVGKHFVRNCAQGKEDQSG